MNKKEIIEKIRKFEFEFNEDFSAEEVEVIFLKEDDEYYYCDVTIVYTGDEGMEALKIEEAEYPKNIIDKM